ncbi:hypothetical protein [Streptomyces sp. NPDC049585]|uniref:hypothetical protein n=1 Tax=Streptomyces sp. NPDC049585 TaxID=3155154 RepID=UPI003435EB18
MTFSIQAGCPATQACASASDMADVIGELYAPEVEAAVLVWNLVPIRLSYGYDVAVMVDDLVPLLEEVQDPGFSATDVFWGPDTFTAEWKLIREGDSLRIRSRWCSVLGGYESLLSERGDVVVGATVFIDEWCKILRRIVADIEAASMELEDDDILVRAKALAEAGPRGGEEHAMRHQ